MRGIFSPKIIPPKNVKLSPEKDAGGNSREKLCKLRGTGVMGGIFRFYPPPPPPKKITPPPPKKNFVRLGG